MAKISIEYSEKRISSPISFWVHKPIDSDAGSTALQFDPPFPKRIIYKGYPIYKIKYRGHELYFCSCEEMEHCIGILSNKVLPTTQALAEEGGYPGYQHIHWLTKWPGDIKSWKDRKEIIKLLKKLIGKAL